MSTVATPFFSVIIPTYNRADLLPRAIISVLQQTYNNWELIIVDDGSKDNTREVVSRHTDPRIKYIYQNNAERSAARNNGIKNATGNYICFLDSDDYYLPERLQGLYNSLQAKQFPVGVYYTGMLVENSTGRNKRNEKQTDNNIFNHIATSVIHSQQACVHRTVFKHYLYDTRFHIGEDMELWLRIADKYPFEYIDNEYTIVVVDHDERSVNVKRYNSYPHQLRMLKTVFAPSHPGHKINNSVKKQLLSNCYFGIAKYYIYTGGRLQAASNLIKAIGANPSHFQTRYRFNILAKLLLPGGTKAAAALLQ